MVIFQTPDGSPGYHQAGELAEAVDFVETLRNDQQVERARIFRMEEVPFEFRGYYRVELKDGSVPEEFSSAPAAEIGGSEEPEEPEELEEDASEPAESSSEPAHPLRRMDLFDGDVVEEDEVEDEPATGWSAAVSVGDERPAMVSAAVGRRGLFGR